MDDLFAPHTPAAAQPRAHAEPSRAAPRATLHSDTEIYRSIAELAKFIARTTSNLRRDLRPTYGLLLVEETSRMSVLLREANIARGADKLPYLDEILRQCELIQFTLRTLDSLGVEWLPHKTFAESMPLTAAVARQAAGLRNHFAPAA